MVIKNRDANCKVLFAMATAMVFMTACPAFGGDVQVVKAVAERQKGGSYRFEVTLRHADAGWDHYADRWEVLSMSGDILATRTLHHPHVDEQPFTRDLSGVRLPGTRSSVRVRGHDSVHGYGSRERVVQLGE